MTLQRYLSRLIWLCLLPLVLMSAYLVYHSVRTIQAEIRSSGRDLANDFSVTLDQNLKARIRALYMLAESPHANDPAQLGELYREAQEFRRQFGADVVLADVNMHMLFNTRVPLGTPLPKLPTPKGRAAAPLALLTGAPAVGDSLLGPVAKMRLVAVAVPGLRDGKVAFLVLATYGGQLFRERLDQVALPAGWAMTIVDGEGEIIAKRAPAGFDSVAHVDSTERFAARSRESRWTVLVEIPRDIYLAPLREAALDLTLLVLGATLAGVLGGMLASRRLGASVSSLAETAGTDVAAPSIAEIATVRRMLDESAAKRAAAEEDRRRSEQRFRTIFEQAGMGIALVGLDGRCLMVNRKLCEFIGYEFDEFLTKSIQDITHPDDIGKDRAGLGRLQAGEIQAYTTEKRYVRKDGGVVWGNLTVSVARHLNGRPSHFIGVVEDIQRRKEAETSYRSLFDNMLNGLAHCQIVLENGQPRDFIYLSVNHAFESLTGLTDVVGRKVTEVIPGIRDTDPGLFEFYGRVANTGQPESCEVFVEAMKNWFSISAYCPQPGQFIAIFDVITARKQALAALEKSEHRFRSLIENASDLIVLIDGNGVIGYASPSLLRMGGYPEGEVLGRSIMEFTHPEDLPAARSALEEVLRNPGKHHSAEIRWRHKYGSFVTLESVAKNELDNPDVGAIIINARDVTLRRLAENEIRDSEARFRAVLEQSIAAIYVIQDGRIVYVNPRMREIFGYALDEEFEPDPLAHVKESDRPKVIAQMQQRLTGEGQAAYAISVLKKDLSEFTLGIHAKLASYKGKPAIIAIAQDITDKARAEEEIGRYIKRLERAMKSTIEVVSTIGELRDPYTHGHERRVAEIASAIATEMGQAADFIEGVRVAGYLHDVGKIAVPAEILSKPSRLSKAEFDLVKDHAQQGYEILKGVDFPWPVAETARQHHERLDGSGYPQGLKNGQIILEARILAVADTVEAMASHRPYRPGLGIDKALAEIDRGRGTAYDPLVADACLRLFRDKGYVLPA